MTHGGPATATSGALLLLAAIALPAAAADVDPVAGIDEAALMTTVAALSDPSMEGRLAGTEGYRRAAAWAARRFAEIGLEPGGDEGFLRHFPCEVNEVEGTPRLTIAAPADAARALTLGPDFVVRGFTGSGAGEDVPVVFVGYGLARPELGYDDYAGVDVRGAVVLAFKQAPPWAPEGGRWGESWTPRPKANAAAQRGAVAVLLVSRPLDEPPQPLIGSVAHGPGDHPAGTPQLHVTVEVADALLGGPGAAAAAQRAIDEGRAPASRRLDGAVSFDVAARHDAEGSCANVVGVLPGTDPARAAEHLIVGAHLDHVGRQGEVLFAGANDNASGSAALLATAAALARAPRARSVVFVLFDGEEQGMLGSRAYAADPIRPLDGAVAMLNADCVGLGGGLRLGGGGAHPALHALARAIDARHDAVAVDGGWYGGGADAQAFFEAGVPTLYFATADSYAHLHRAGDTAATLQPPLLTEVARLLYRTSAAVAAGGYEREPRQPELGEIP